jgi:nitroreductase
MATGTISAARASAPRQNNYRITMSEIIDFLRTRRSVKPRDMSGAGPSPAELETILTIGARVPDHGKIAPWRFIVFEGDARKKAGEIFAQVLTKKNPDASEQDIAKARDAFMEAPLVIAVVSSTKPHPKVPPWEQQLSAGASAMNIVTAATALGYGANWLTGWFAFDRDVLTALGLKPEEQLAGFVHIGKSAKPNEDRPRPAITDLVTRF